MDLKAEPYNLNIWLCLKAMRSALFIAQMNAVLQGVHSMLSVPALLEAGRKAIICRPNRAAKKNWGKDITVQSLLSLNKLYLPKLV